MTVCILYTVVINRLANDCMYMQCNAIYVLYGWARILSSGQFVFGRFVMIYLLQYCPRTVLERVLILKTMNTGMDHVLYHSNWQCFDLKNKKVPKFSRWQQLPVFGILCYSGRAPVAHPLCRAPLNCRTHLDCSHFLVPWET